MDASKTAAEFEREKAELEILSASGVFNRASSLAQVLTYICGKYFEHATGEIKEYNIGVEALGRPPDFDQKKDSIVRVEAHRLRKRLREYYEREGSSHAVHIELPAGQYVPRFVFLQPDSPTAASERAKQPPVETIPGVEPPKLRRPGWLWWAVAGLLVLSLAGFQLFRGSSAKPKNADVLADSNPPMLPDSAAIRILAGAAGSYVDRSGHVWQADRYFNAGLVYESTNHAIAGTRDPRIFQTRREGTFRYDIPLKPGSYEMRLYFAETVYGESNVGGGGESNRVFSVSANGRAIAREIDVISDAGASTADVRAFKDIAPASDGKLHLTFEQHSNAPMLSAIEIIPGIPGKMRPIRLIAQDRVHADHNGHSWEPEGCVRGGQLVSRTEPVKNTADPELFRGERFGNFQYVIAVPPGQYAIVFHFAEAWFGPANPGKGGAGSRLFDILCGGVALKRNIDIFQEAGGSGRAVTWTAHGLEPNQQGKLAISFLPVLNYASLNALEVLDESK
jgi:hypothetical protein